jgi:hypothetical protein
MQGIPDIVVLSLEAIEPTSLPDIQEMRLGQFGQIAKVAEVSLTYFVEETARTKPVMRKLTNGCKHREPRVPTVASLPNQALRYERGDPVECVDSEFAARVAEGLRSFDGATACENGQSGK